MGKREVNRLPQDFEKCQAEGGRVRTMKVGKGKYFRICYDKAGKSHKGEMKQTKEKE